MNPITRKEVFLAAAGGQDVETPTPVTREEVFLDEIAKGGGGSSLPSTETASTGDVLSLDDNKEPQWAAPSGSGGGVLVVNVTEGSGGVNVCDKTAAEMYQAFQNGLVQFYFVDTYSLCTSACNAEGYGYSFTVGGAEAIYHADSGTDFPTDA